VAPEHVRRVLPQRFRKQRSFVNGPRPSPVRSAILRRRPRSARWHPRPRLTAEAILSAVRSWRSRPTSGAYVRRGNNTVTLGAWMVADLLHYQLLCHATEVTIRALEQPQ